MAVHDKGGESYHVEQIRSSLTDNNSTSIKQAKLKSVGG